MSVYRPLSSSTEVNSGTRRPGQKTCMARHRFDYTCCTCRNIARCFNLQVGFIACFEMETETGIIMFIYRRVGMKNVVAWKTSS